MLDPRGLYTWERKGLAAADVALERQRDGLVMFCHFYGHVDAGGTGELVVDQMLDVLPHDVVARFDHDQLVDMRAQRPAMTYKFASGRFTSYSPPVLDVRLMQDAAGTPFLLLSGPEPDAQWGRFVAAVQLIAERLKVRLSVDFHGLPMQVPHTRPVGLSAYGNRIELIPGQRTSAGEFRGSAGVGDLLQHRLMEAGYEVLSIHAHVPSYLATAYPDASLVVVETMSAATGLKLSGLEYQLRRQARRVQTRIDRELQEGGEQVGSMVRFLELQYDSNPEADSVGGVIAPVDLPSGDEIGLQFERFLAEQEGDAGS
ncbi:PAC2 family protein [Streptomyces sp. NPDC059215]|uniref:PAC2 family protein n=1 Tax=Streptomyces sp. NPDC059215 TaxID=3346772 RepID=UPI00368A9284